MEAIIYMQNRKLCALLKEYLGIFTQQYSLIQQLLIIYVI